MTNDLDPQGGAPPVVDPPVVDLTAADPAAPPVTDPPATDPPPPAKPWFQSIYDENGKYVKAWQDQLPTDAEDIKSFAAQFDDPIAQLRAHKANQQFAREKGNIKPLTEKSTPAEIADYRAKMGVPETPYEFAKPEELPEGLAWPEQRAKEFGEIAQKENWTPAQANKAMELHMKYLAEDYAAGAAAQKAQMDQNLAAEKELLEKTYGGTLDTTIVAAKRAAAALNIPIQALDPASPSFLGVAMLGVFSQVSELLGESRLPTTATVTNMSPGLQASDIQMNPGNPEHALFLKGDPRVMAKILELNKQGVAARGR